MSLPKQYHPQTAETEMEARWQEDGIYQFHDNDPRPVFSIDTPPATVSGRLHLGHVYSYSHTDFMARYFRMRGYNLFYPMGFDDNGLPTEHYVEKKLNITAQKLGRQAFIEQCLKLSIEEEEGYRALWRRLGLSIDWRHTYRTIDEHSRRCSQHSFLELYHKGAAYKAQAPMIWCPTCRTAIAQAEQEDQERTTEFLTLPFTLENQGRTLLVATTRPELLAACVAVFVHPDDARYRDLAGATIQVPLYGQRVPLLADAGVDPAKGTGAVMCCTFGDQADVAWWYSHHLPLIVAIDEQGRMTERANLSAAQDETLEGLPVEDARRKIKDILQARGLILASQPAAGAIRVHERCGTPVEFQVTAQWFIRVLENKKTFLELGEQLKWHPAQMHARYQAWVENLAWDWCISRQRTFGVPFPVWYCKACGAVITAKEEELPVDPLARGPSTPCACGSNDFQPDTDVMDTWATSSVSAEIVTGWLEQPQFFSRMFPLTLRTQAHEIIRTWTFYSIVKSWYHFGRLPWSEVMISGWALAGKGMEKISKSKGGGPMEPMKMIERYSADPVRYWAASTATGKDTLISEEKIQMGVKLVTKLWNVARFAEPFVSGALPPLSAESLTPADRWILASLQSLVERVTAAFDHYEYATAKAEAESFFWHHLADNYLEMAKLRLYDTQHPANAGARHALREVLRVLLKLFAPLLPFVTEAIWQELFRGEEGVSSIHLSAWPAANPASAETQAEEALGAILIDIATAARRYKSEHALSLGSELAVLQLAVPDAALARQLAGSLADLTSVTRARSIQIVASLDPSLACIDTETPGIQAGLLL